MRIGCQPGVQTATGVSIGGRAGVSVPTVSVAAYANGSAVTLNGTDEYFTWDDAASVYSWTQPFSGVVRCKWSSTDDTLISFGEAGGNTFWAFKVGGNGKPGIVQYDAGVLKFYAYADDAMLADRWYELAFYCDPQDASASLFWLNGVSSTVTTHTNAPTEITPTLGTIGASRRDTVSNWWDGLIAEVALAPNHTIDGTQVSASYASRRFANPATVTTLGDAITHHVSAAVVEDTTDLSTLVAGGAKATGVNLAAGNFSAADSPWWSVALSADLNGTDDHLSVDGLESVGYNHAGHTVLAWAKRDAAADVDQILTFFAANTATEAARAAFHYDQTNKLKSNAIDSADVSAISVQSTATLGTATWVHYGWQQDPSADASSALYADGSSLSISKDEGNNTDVTSLLAQASIGVLEYAGTLFHPHDGHIALVVVVPRNLTAGEVAEAYASGDATFNPMTASFAGEIVGCYPFGLADENGDIPNVAHATLYDATAVNGITFTTDVP